MKKRIGILLYIIGLIVKTLLLLSTICLVVIIVCYVLPNWLESVGVPKGPLTLKDIYKFIIR